ncbi:MAG: hypothetical protein HUK09_07360 [Bacteroidaceae bacterium]|nr:hypothetical protein [Bacteroidaceae bacterium]
MKSISSQHVFDHTLEGLQLRRASLELQIKQIEMDIEREFRGLVQPDPIEAKGVEAVVKKATTAWSIIDGAWAGYKLYRRFSGLFRKKR